MAAESSSKIRSTPLSGLHLLLTYACNYECDHCFVWSGPSQGGTMTIETIEHILAEVQNMNGLWNSKQVRRPVVFSA
jgi:sulfatase maturation enzyme AslB (radical SAM superfamily)